MNDAPSSQPASDALAELVGVVLEQAVEVADLDSARAEAWASDVLAIAQDDGVAVDALVAALRSSEAEPAPAGAVAAALAALSAYADVSAVEADAAPEWASAIGSSRCDAAWLLRAGNAVSAAFRFVDSLDAAHVVTADLERPEAGGDETLGEIVLGAGDLLDALDESDASVEIEPVPAEAMPALAERVAVAYRATTAPRESAVINSRLLIARLATLSDVSLEPFSFVADDVPELPERDPDDDAYAIDILTRALAALDPESSLPSLDEADNKRARLAAVAGWIDAAPFDEARPERMDAADVVAAAVSPIDLAPLLPVERDAVLTLEWADWLGAIIGLVRDGVGTKVDGESLVDAINRCPEVTSTIPKSDRGRIAWAFDTILTAFAAVGIVDDGALTELGAVALPIGALRAWSPAS